VTTPGRHERHVNAHGRHVKKVNARRLTLLFFLLFVGALILWALIYSIVNPSPHGSQSHAAQSTSTPAPTHANPVPKRTAPPPARTAPSKPKPRQSVTPTPSRPLVTRYTVKPGDNLSSIAEMYRLPSYIPLYDANHAAVGNNPNIIHVGLRLRVPARKEA
jgi:nucleoid-associated protein YgaU